MDATPATDAAPKPTQAKRRQTQSWQTVVASGLVGLLGALIGGGVTFATTSRQLASQERVAVTERAHQDQLNRIARRNDIYTAFFASLVAFEGAANEYNVDDRLGNRRTLKQYEIVSKMATDARARQTPLQLLGSPAVNEVSSNAMSRVADLGQITVVFTSIVSKEKLQTLLTALRASMVKLLQAMRDDLNVSRQ